MLFINSYIFLTSLFTRHFFNSQIRHAELHVSFRPSWPSSGSFLVVYLMMASLAETKHVVLHDEYVN
jgi:hypothetical protein